ncbi:MAG TPA: YicC family protein, partial [bacterium]|nr:YicC family protein [bacterium]
MIESMTAYGSIEFEHGNKKISLELRSVNHRFFDVRIKTPMELMSIEPDIRKVLRDKLERGSIDCFIRIKTSVHTEVDADNSKELRVDWKLLEQYLESVKDIKYRLKIKGDLNIQDIIRLKDLFIAEEAQDKDRTLQTVILENLNTCVESVIKMRKEEGATLSTVMENLVSDIEQKTKIIEEKIKNAYKETFNKLKDKLASLLNNTQISMDRIVTEAGIMSERLDISEEIDRLHSHYSQFRNELKSSSSAVGKKLDFIVQEMNREINTIASKSEEKEVVYLAVEVKTLVEKIREQVQNV